MNANVSRDVIADLLPAYLSGEASADTRALIESCMKQDAELAALIQRESAALNAVSAAPMMARDREMDSLRKTKRLLRRRAWFLGLAIFFTLTTASYQYGPEGIKWTWQDFPAWSVLSAVLGLILWVVYFRSRRRLEITGV